jgi:hypothetical protein
MENGECREERLTGWSNVPDGSEIRIRVSDGDYAVTGRGVLRTPGRLPEDLEVSRDGLVGTDYVRTITTGAFFRLTVDIIYLLQESTTAIVEARVVTPTGDLYQDMFRCTYEGSAGSTNPTDDVTIVAAGVK